MYGGPDANYPTRFLKSLPKNVAYHGPYDRFFALPLENYDGYLYTSLYDGTPNVLLEAAAAELPIVSSNVGGISEFIEDSTSGFLVDDIWNAAEYADRLRRLFQEPELLARFSSNLAKTLTTSHSRGAYREAIQKLLSDIGY
jgi:glycosyltransferase involved in cell wall biosynthesis